MDSEDYGLIPRRVKNTSRLRRAEPDPGAQTASSVKTAGSFNQNNAAGE